MSRVCRRRGAVVPVRVRMAAVLSLAWPGFLPLVVGDGSAAGWILFLLFAAGDGGAAERILLLLEHPGEFVRLDLLCEAGWSPSVGVWMDLLFGVLLLGFVVGVVLIGVRVACWVSGLAVAEGFGADSREPTAVLSNQRSLAAFQRLGSALCFGLVMIGGWKSGCYARWPAELLRQRRRRKTIHSSVQGLVVIFFLLRVLYAKKDCTVLDL